ncbi:phosphomannomutase/phosphoglucomutase, partial [Neisseria meningitidis]|nr:phosphomannomutase/phosphoglucomutase [Neisseria meningitidis]
QELLAIVEKDGFVAADKQGSVTEKDISGEYHNNIVGHIKLKRPMKIVIDAGNGVGGAFAGKLYKGLGNEVAELFCEV